MGKQPSCSLWPTVQAAPWPCHQPIYGPSQNPGPICHVHHRSTPPRCTPQWIWKNVYSRSHPWIYLFPKPPSRLSRSQSLGQASDAPTLPRHCPLPAGPLLPRLLVGRCASSAHLIPGPPAGIRQARYGAFHMIQVFDIPNNVPAAPVNRLRWKCPQDLRLEAAQCMRNEGVYLGFRTCTRICSEGGAQIRI